MKILFLNNFYYLRGGSERVLFDEMRLLREAGHETAIFSRAHDLNEPSAFQEFFPPPLDLEKVPLSLKTVKTVKELVYSRASRRGLREVIARFRPDVAHAHNIYGRLSLSVLDELKEAGIPVVMTLHDLKLLCPSYLMLNDGKVCERCKVRRYHHAVLSRCHKGSYPASLVYALESWFNHGLRKYASVKKFITPSRFLRDKCVEYGWAEDKFELIPNLVESVASRETAGEGGYLLYFGRLSREKGVRTLLEAYRRLRPELPLMVVGDGPERPALEGVVDEAGLAVTFTGYLRVDALTGALAGAKAVVVPSECYENAPLSVLEALAAGKPVIASRIGGIPELVMDGINAFLFEPGAASSLEEALSRFLSLSESAVASMGEAARAKVAQENCKERHLSMLLELYRQALH